MRFSVYAHCRSVRICGASQKHLLLFRPSQHQCRKYAARTFERKPTAAPAKKASSTAPSTSLVSPKIPISDKPPPAKSRNLSAEEALNPPSSTLPPLLNTPIRTSSIPAYKHYYSLGRAYLTFYKTGFKAIYTNFRLAQSFQQKLADSSSPVGPFSSRRAIQEALFDGTLTRGQYHLFLRVKNDVSRIPLFGLVFCVFGEFTPLIVTVLSPVVPKTLWVPRQWQKARLKAQKRREHLVKDGITGGKGLAQLNEQEVENFDLSDAGDVRRLKGLAQWVGAYPRLWDRVLGGALPVSVVKSRLQKKARELQVDDFAIERDGGVAHLSVEEMKVACDMRGLDVLDKGEEDIRSNLSRWLEEGRKARNRTSGRIKAAIAS